MYLDVFLEAQFVTTISASFSRAVIFLGVIVVSDFLCWLPIGQQAQRADGSSGGGQQAQPADGSAGGGQQAQPADGSSGGGQQAQRADGEPAEEIENNDHRQSARDLYVT